ncbi:NAD(P)-dependent alcohol dehydrogenase [Oceanobacillus manasiensis]|uniref:NAD(P)-dependent alcohol dehydrogenase n=1 Tax=Oceanobacillus manasiensis TaxID=586413 RepID=UPI0005A9EB2F|nr:NAD(P)-dependent alcohol dehydrogenase [Oceanobacillus manasiensis]
MKAIISEKYGLPDTLKLRELATPIPVGNQVRVKIHASSINFGNLVLLSGKPLPARLAFGLIKPKYPIPGGDIAGVVESVGEKVNQLKVGDEVYGDLSGSGWGAFAEYVVVDEKELVLKPRNLSFTESAAVPMAASTALQAIRDKGMIRSGQEVLIHGASGGVGTFAIQIAKAFGANVTALVSTRNIDIAKSLGADYIIDYKTEELHNDNRTFDLIIGANGSQSISTYKRKLKDNGIFVHIGGKSSQLFQTTTLGSWLSIFGKKKYRTFSQGPNPKDLLFIKDLIEEGKIKPIIDRSFSLSEVPEAFQYALDGHLQGKIIITI